MDKPWQGADPFKARFLFVGLDANYAPDVEQQIPEIIDYLTDEPGFWRRTGYHHPFRLPKYEGCGNKYHARFAEIGFSTIEADQVSFIELLHLPTIGTNKLDVTDLSPDHIKRLKEIIEEGHARYIFIPSSALQLMRKTKRFPWISQEPLRTDGNLEIIHENSSKGQVIYRMYHLSCYGWQTAKLRRQLGQVRKLVAELRDMHNRYK